MVKDRVESQTGVADRIAGSAATHRPPLSERLLAPQTLCIAASLAFAFSSTAVQQLGIDAWWMLATGRLIIETGQIPGTYPFAFAPQVPGFTDSQWLAQLVYFAPYPLLGLQGIVALNAVLVTFIFAVLMRVAWLRSRSVAIAAGCTTLAVLLMQRSLQPRAQNLGYGCFALTLWALMPLERFSPQRFGIRLLALGSIEALWANSHGSFFLGPVVTALVLLGELLETRMIQRRLTAVAARRTGFLVASLAVQGAATLATPFGLDLHRYIVRLAGNAAVRSYVMEWAPTWKDPASMDLLGASAVLVVASMALAWRRQRPVATDVLVLLAFGFLAFQAVRNVEWWQLVSAPILAVYVARVPLPHLRHRTPADTALTLKRAVNGGVLVALVVCAMSFLPWIKDANPLVSANQRGMTQPGDPVAAASFLLTRPSCGRIFAPQWWSGQLNWRLWPHCQTMIDIPVEVFQPEAIQDFLVINAGNDSWHDLLSKYRVDTLLISRGAQANLLTRVQQSEHWDAIYEDDQRVIFVRQARCPSTSGSY